MNRDNDNRRFGSLKLVTSDRIGKLQIIIDSRENHFVCDIVEFNDQTSFVNHFYVSDIAD